MTFPARSRSMSFFRAIGLRRIAWSLRRLHVPVGADALVLEVGSGGNPYPRANVLLDGYEEGSERLEGELVHDRPLVLGVIERLPFRDRAFDFIIASHVLEHTADPDAFLSELMRVGKAGYIETPDAFFERINPFIYHRLEVRNGGGRLRIHKKSSWRHAGDLVDSYESKVKDAEFLRFVASHPEAFHMRFYWRDRIDYEVLNPEVDASWPVTTAAHHTSPGSGRLRLRTLMRTLLSQSKRNAAIDVFALLRCPDCEGTELRREGDSLTCVSCGAEYEVREGVPRMFPTKSVIPSVSRGTWVGGGTSVAPHPPRSLDSARDDRLAAHFDRLQWRDPLSGAPMTPVVAARTPAGVPIHGALRIGETGHGYPIVDCVVRATPELAGRYASWLEPFGLQPPPERGGTFQGEETVDSFGFQWSWNSAMRSDADLEWRVAERFRLRREELRGLSVLDAGAGAGDQSRWMAAQGAAVVSVDLSGAIEVVARKLRMNRDWVGVQGDVAALPFAAGQFDLVYCEGVIQHTRDSAATIGELLRVLRAEGRLLASHYTSPGSLRGRARVGFVTRLRTRLSRMDRYRLLFVTGILAALAYVPGLRTLVRRSGAAAYYDLMPDFKTTWTNTFDSYGSHTYQRVIAPETFWSYFDAAGNAERVFTDPVAGTVVARKARG